MFNPARLLFVGLPKMVVIRNYFGVPSPTSGPALSIKTNDVIELICADLHSPWWQVRGHAVYPSHTVFHKCQNRIRTHFSHVSVRVCLLHVSFVLTS